MSDETITRLIPAGVPFTQIAHTAIEDPTITASAFRIYCYLMRRANSESRAWPSVRTISEAVHLNKSTVVRSIRQLTESGWLKVYSEESATTGHRQRHVYVVHGDRTHKATGRVKRPVAHETETVRIEDTNRTHKAYITTTNELQPEKNNHLATQNRNYGWDFFTHPEGFNLPTSTKKQQTRVGALAREVNATLDSNEIPSDQRMDRLMQAAASWPEHFESATLTPDAFEKHLPALLRAPLRGSKQLESQKRMEAIKKAMAGR